MDRNVTPLLLTARILAIFLVFCCAWPALAQDRGKSGATVDRLAGQAILSPEPFPESFSSDPQFHSTMRKMQRSTFTADPKKGWDIWFLAFFPIPLEEMSCQVHIFDVTHKSASTPSRHVESFNQFLARRGQRTLGSQLHLDPERFEKDHTYRMIVARNSDRGLLAEARFVLRADR